MSAAEFVRRVRVAARRSRLAYSVFSTVSPPAPDLATERDARIAADLRSDSGRGA